MVINLRKLAGISVIALGVGSVAAATAAMQSAPAPDRLPPELADSAPASPTRVAAELRAPDGRSFGVVTYTNRHGRRCFASGQVSSGRVGTVVRGRFADMPLDESGNCAATPDPIAVELTRSSDDSSTTADEGALRVAGLAAAGVQSIIFETAGRSVVVRPEKDGAFVAELPMTGDVVGVSVDDGRGLRRITKLSSMARPVVPVPSPAEVARLVTR